MTPSKKSREITSKRKLLTLFQYILLSSNSYLMELITRLFVYNCGNAESTCRFYSRDIKSPETVFIGDKYIYWTVVFH
jgi:hypothetical protein